MHYLAIFTFIIQTAHTRTTDKAIELAEKSCYFEEIELAHLVHLSSYVGSHIEKLFLVHKQVELKEQLRGKVGEEELGLGREGMREGRVRRKKRGWHEKKPSGLSRYKR